MPIERGRSIMITVFIDSSHTANKKKRRSHTRLIIFINRAPIEDSPLTYYVTIKV